MTDIKKHYRYFWNFVKRQENWLNKMGSENLKLIKVGKLRYDFEAAKDKYIFRVINTMRLSKDKREELIESLNKLGYETFNKNINLDWSKYKVNYQGQGVIGTKPGNIDKELLIVQKKDDGKPFDIEINFK